MTTSRCQHVWRFFFFGCCCCCLSCTYSADE